MRKNLKLTGLWLALPLLFFSLPAHLNAQNVAKRITASNGDTIPFLEYRPAGHHDPGNIRKYPLIVFLHGIGERSDNKSLSPGSPVWRLQGLDSTANTGFGPSRLVKLNYKMAFTWNGQNDTFLVLSPMSRLTERLPPHNNIGVWKEAYINSIIKYAKDSLKVDTNRIFLTGLSFGGGGTFRYISSDPSHAKKLAGAATICAAWHFLFSTGPTYVKDANLPVWGFHAEDDFTQYAEVGSTIRTIDSINKYNPAVKAIKTIWPTGGHNIWPRVYDIDVYPYGYDGILNIYEWFLGQNKSLAHNILPVANAGNDITISQSAGTTTLNGSLSIDADGTLVRYVWRKISGPAGGTIATPLDTVSSTTVSGLTTVGVYRYQLTVVDDRAAIARDTLTITVVDSAVAAGKAVTMLVTSSRINAGNVAELINSSAFTVEALFKYDSIATDWSNVDATIFRKQVTTTDRIKLKVEKATNSIHFTLANGSDIKGYTNPGVVSHDTWYHIAAVFDGAQTGNANRMKVYINGVPQTLHFTDSIVSSTSGSSGSCLFGGEPSASKVTAIDEVRVWDTVVAPGTIHAWRNKLLGNCHPNINRLTVYWPLDNDANPASATAALGTIYPGVITSGSYVDAGMPLDTIPCPVDSGKAVNMLTSTSRINAGNVAELSNSTAFTIEAHFKYDSTVTGWVNADATIFRKHVTATDRIRLYVAKASRSVHFVLANGSDIKGYTNPNVVSHDTWYHVAAVFDGPQALNANRMRIYINGVQQPLSFTDSIGSSTSGSSGSCLFGGEPSASQVTVIDEVRVWDTVLASGTIDIWKNKLVGSCHPNFNRLTVYWPLDNNANPASAAAALGTIYPGIVTNGSYVGSIQATAGSGCPNPRIAQPPLGDKLVDDKPFTGRIYPNPTDGLLQLEVYSTQSRMLTVNVVDMFGRYLFRSQRPLMEGNNRLSVNIASLPAGTYVVEVGDGKRIREQYKVLKR